MRFFLCFIFIFTFKLLYSQQLSWALSEPGTGIGSGDAMAIDSAGNMYVSGEYNTGTDIDPGPGVHVPAGSGGHFLEKLDNTGNLIWEVHSTAFYTGIALDASGNIYVSGDFTGGVVFAAGISIGSSGMDDIYIAKLDNDGNYLWAKSIGGSSYDTPTDLFVDNSSNIYLTGRYQSAMDFDPGTGVFTMAPIGSDDVFTLKLDSAGNFIWAKSLGSINTEKSWVIHVDDLGNVYTGGEFKGTCNFDPGYSGFSIASVTSTNLDGFIVKYDAYGNFIWAKSIGSNADDDVHILIKDNLNNLYIGGFTSGDSTDFDPGASTHFLPGPPTPGELGYIVKLDDSDNFMWARQHTSLGGTSRVDFLALDNDHFLYLLGRFQGFIDFDPDSGVDDINSPDDGFSDPHLYLQKVDPFGNFFNVKPFIGSSSIYSIAAGELIVDQNKNIFVTGDFAGTYDFDPGIDTLSISTVGTSSDMFLFKLNQDTCLNYLIVIDSILNNTCAGPGFGLAHTNNGFGNSNYTWNTIPITNDSVVAFTLPGIFTITASDTFGCVASKKVLICGPTSTTNYDLNVNLIAAGFRPGVNTTIFLDAFNDGCDTVSGNVFIVLDSNVNYNYSVPSPDLISGDTLYWDFTSICYDSAHITPYINVTTLPGTILGDTLSFTVKINPIAGDADTSNNFKIYSFIASNSYDPNDKQVYPQGECVPKYVLKDEKLTYTIRFQNTGTADAVNIYVLDTLDPNLDLYSVRVIGQSAYVITEVLPGNVLKFRFDNINLPDSTSDEPDSHGYVIYEVDALPSVPNNTIINNTANIFFDFNPPVATNTISSTLVDSLPHFSSSQNINITCGSNYTFPDGFVQTGISINISHISIFSPVSYCDSTITTNIIVDPLNTGVTQSSFTLTATATGVTYQWIDCNNSNFPIAGETNQTFTATSDGDYAVVITNGSCSDTSACYNVTGTGVSNLNRQNAISVYPNPTNSSITISSNTIAEKIMLKDVFGRTIKAISPNSTKATIDLHELETGIYFVSVVNNGMEQTVKIVKN